jgi:hypothetical protein
LFCFEGSLFGEFQSWTAHAPDCFLVEVNSVVNPKVWFDASLGSLIALCVAALIIAIAVFKNRGWGFAGLRWILLAVGAYFAVLGYMVTHIRFMGFLTAGVSLVLAILTFRFLPSTSAP